MELVIFESRYSWSESNLYIVFPFFQFVYITKYYLEKNLRRIMLDKTRLDKPIVHPKFFGLRDL